jgi:ketosteroid isomerase-like protein
MSEENVEIVRASWEAWRRGDMDALFEFYDPEVEWDMTHSYVPDMGVFHGHEGCGSSFVRGGRSSPSTTPSRSNSSAQTTAWWSG